MGRRHEATPNGGRGSRSSVACAANAGPIKSGTNAKLHRSREQNKSSTDGSSRDDECERSASAGCSSAVTNAGRRNCRSVLDAIA